MEHVPSIEVCSGLIANLEGYKKLPLRQHDTSKTTELPTLEKRLRGIEKAMGVKPPPPDTEPSWVGLATRLYRLQNMAHTHFPWLIVDNKTTMRDEAFELMLPVGDMAFDIIKTAVDDIETQAPFIEWPKYDSDEILMRFARQKLCYFIGWRGNLITKIPTRPLDIYICAVRMTLLPKLQTPGQSVPLPPNVIPLPRGVSTKPRKVCCDPCSCTCHYSNQVSEAEVCRASALEEAVVYRALDQCVGFSG